MCSRRQRDTHFEAGRDGPEDLQPDGQADEGGHGAVRNCRGEHDVDAAVDIVHRHALEFRDLQLLESIGVLRILKPSE